SESMSPANPMPLTYELLHDRADSLGRHFARVRPSPAHLESLRVFVRNCLSLPEDSRDMVAEVRRQAFEKLLSIPPGSTFDPAALLGTRRLTEQVLDTLTESIDLCLELVVSPDVQAHFVDDARSLRAALADLRSIRSEFSDNFPLMNEEDLA